MLKIPQVTRKLLSALEQSNFFHDIMASNIIDKTKHALHFNKEGDIKIAGRKVHGTGYGLMGLTWRPQPPSQEQAFTAMSTSHLSTRYPRDTDIPPQKPPSTAAQTSGTGASSTARQNAIAYICSRNTLTSTQVTPRRSSSPSREAS